MTDRHIEHHRIITAVVCILSCNEMCLPVGELETMKAAGKILDPFEVVTREMSEDKHLSIFIKTCNSEYN